MQIYSAILIQEYTYILLYYTFRINYIVRSELISIDYDTRSKKACPKCKCYLGTYVCL